MTVQHVAIKKSDSGDIKVSLSGETVQVSSVSLPLPSGAATELTSSSSNQLLDELVFILQSMLEKMPRVTGNDQAAVSLEGGTVTAVTTVGTVTTVSQVGTRAAMTAADALIMHGTSHIYNNLVVS